MTNTEKKFTSFSPFSPAMVWEKRNRALLIQFLGAELMSIYRSLRRGGPVKEILTADKRFFPYDWSYSYGYLNKAREHSLILESAFPELPGEVKHLQLLLAKSIATPKTKAATLKLKLLKNLPAIFGALEPFLEICKENENLIFFLLKHKEEIDHLMKKGYLTTLLYRFHPAGFSELCEKLCDNYHHRGFYFLIPEIKQLLAKLEHAS